jgi:hypothetical protein
MRGCSTHHAYSHPGVIHTRAPPDLAQDALEGLLVQIRRQCSSGKA